MELKLPFHKNYSPSPQTTHCRRPPILPERKMMFRCYCIAALAILAASSSIAGVSATGEDVEKSLRGGGASAENQQHHRVLQEGEVFTFLLADIQYNDGGFTSSGRKLQANPKKPEHTKNVQDVNGNIYSIVEGTGDTTGIASGELVTLPAEAYLDHKNGNIHLANGKIEKAKKKSNKKRDLQEDATSSTDEQKRRHLAATWFSSTTTVVAVMVNAIDGSYNGGTAADLYNHVFGMSDLSLKMGYEQCSHGKMTISPGGASYGITNGVITINVSETVKQADGTTPNDAAIRNAVTAAINAQYGVTSPDKIANQ